MQVLRAAQDDGTTTKMPIKIGASGALAKII
jgi:hypothetical protein